MFAQTGPALPVPYVYTTPWWRFPSQSILDMREFCAGGLYGYVLSRRVFREQLCLLSFLIRPLVCPVRRVQLRKGHTYSYSSEYITMAGM